MNITLIGMPTSGKSNIGKILAKKLNYSFLDTDDNIYKIAKESKIDIKRSDKEYLKIEELVGQSLNVISHVIATGGSMIMCKKAMENIKRISKVIWINTDFDTLKIRLEDVWLTRGIIGARDMNLSQLYNFRMPLYKKYSDYEIKPDGDMEQTAENIFKILGEQNIIKY